MKIFTSIIVILLFAGLSVAALALDNAEMKNMFQRQVLSTCNDNGFVSCIGVSKNKCASAAKEVLSSCDDLFPEHVESMNDTKMDAYRGCLRKGLMTSVGVSKSKLDACGNKANQAPEASATMNTGDIAQFQQMMKTMSQLKGTKGVTLPVYKPAKIVSHTDKGTFDGGMMLPALIMWSTDTPKKIAGFYRKKLKSFKEFKAPGGVVFMQHAGKHFDLDKDLKTYYAEPHVLVSKEVDGLPQKAKSRIEIGYKK